MHYIRFLKSPKITKDSRGVHNLNAVLTITTDLGDSFLYSDLPLLVELEDALGNKLPDGGKPKEYLWTGSDGFKGLPVEVPIGKKTIRGGVEVTMVVKAKEDLHRVESFEHVLGRRDQCIGDEGGIVSLRGNAKGSGMVERVLTYGDGQTITIWEEAGESIARHIWDAGLVLSAYLSMTYNDVPSTSLPQLPTLQGTLSKHDLNILELGAGCGIVGITLRQLLPNISQMTLTDLPEATAILTHNISLCSPAPSHCVLDWSLPLPASVASTQWNLILIADCTYNADVVPDLVKTLGRLAAGNDNLAVLLAMKVRHESEAIFFTLMADGGWRIKESMKLPLPVLGGEDEEIEIFLFGASARNA